MKRYLLLNLFLILNVIPCFSQTTLQAPLNISALGYSTSSDTFNYSTSSLRVGNYSIGFFNDPFFTGAPTAFLSGYGGIKLFTSGLPRFTITRTGNVGVGTTSPLGNLDVNISNNVEAKNAIFYTPTGFNPVNSSIGGLRFAWYQNNFAEIQMLRGSSSNDGLGLTFNTSTTNNSSTIERMRITSDGNVCIGATDPKGYKFAVNGNIVANSMVVKLNANWPDFVFLKDYHLPSLANLAIYVRNHHHLPEIPSQKVISEYGQNLGQINEILIKKVEELTLYAIRADREIKVQKELLMQDHNSILELKKLFIKKHKD